MNPIQQPETAEAINNRGEAKRKQGDLDGALADFNKIIEMKPDAVGRAGQHNFRHAPNHG
jgi:hypothetical protein